ncbi:MAG: Holliday junction branch migration protein RuvA [Oscillospiraceae bacterium]|nr:Holliday junction branch migration protein RuvA [Oscillospiraceae bacterium]
MFYYLNGMVALLDAGLAVIDCGGVGYACRTSTYTQSRLTVGKPAKLLIFNSIREDTFDLYGFATKEEKACFEQLLGVSGVGPKAALALLSAVTPPNLAMAILSEDEKLLMSAPGVGKKMAQRVILELKDKMGKLHLSADDFGVAASPAVTGGAAGEAAAALVVLGYDQPEIAAAMKGIDPALSTEEMVRIALRNMLSK